MREKYLYIVFNYSYNYFNKLFDNNLYKYQNNLVASFIEELKLKIISREKKSNKFHRLFRQSKERNYFKFYIILKKKKFKYNLMKYF